MHFNILHVHNARDHVIYIDYVTMSCDSHCIYHVTDTHTHRNKSRSLVGYKSSVYLTEYHKTEFKKSTSLNSKVTELESIKITPELNHSKYI